MSRLSTFRQGLRRTAADPLFGLAFQGTAAETYLLRVEDGLLTEERVKLVDGTLGSALTPEGLQLARQMRS